MGIAPNSRGKAFSLSPLNMLAVMGFFLYGLYHSKLPSIFSVIFIMKGCGILSNSFVASTEMILVLFFPLNSMVIYHDG